MTHQTIAVLTGDIVNSTAMSEPQLSQAFFALTASAKALEKWNKEPLNFTRHRGDGWQIILKQPELAPRAALVFRSSLKALNSQWDSYVGISSGKNRGTISSNLNNETGEVFINSGFALEQAKDGKTETRMPTDTLNDKTRSVLLLLEFIFSGWTQVQTAAMYHALSDRFFSPVELAAQLGKSRQSLEKSLKSAGNRYVQQSLLNWENKGHEP